MNPAGVRQSREARTADDLLVEQCKAGDEVAFELLYRRYAGQVYGHLCRLLGSGSEAEDALQQTFLQAYRSIEKFRGDSRLSTWLHGIAVRVSLNIMRSHRRRRRAMDSFVQDSAAADHAPHVDDHVEQKQVADKVQQHLHRLTPEKRVAFSLYYFQRAELDDVAEQMGTSKKTAWVRIKRARVDIVRAMEKETAMARRRRGTLS